MAEYIEREALLERIDDIWDCADLVFEPNDHCCRADDCASCKWAETKKAIRKIAADFPAADVPPALWTDEPISGSEFMTHKQGQSGFEIHFRTDDKAKYEAVQDECRRQIGHAKPAADVRPVVRAEWYGEADGYADGELVYDMWSCPVCGKRFEEWEEKPDWNFCPNCGADMREE